MAEVSRALSVPTSTLYQWAARGQWRQADLAEAAVVGQAAPGRFEAGAEADTDAQTGAAAPDVPNLPPDEAARYLMARASRYGVGGQIAKAAATARLARQFLDLSVRAAEAEALKAQADLKSRRQLPPELVGMPLDAHCFPLEFPPGWTLKRARAEGRNDLIPIEVLREDLRHRFCHDEPAEPQTGIPSPEPEPNPDPAPEPQPPFRRRERPHVSIRRL